jgi:cobalt-zinc-cadmium efflux system membrane fusion protein
MNQMNKLVLLVLIISFTACQNSGNINPETKGASRRRMEEQGKRIRGGHKSVESHPVLEKSDTVFVSVNSLIRTNLKMETVVYQEYIVQFTTTGVVKPLSGHKAEITAPFEGRIVKSFTKLGQKVKTGTPLFEVSSSDYLETVRMFLQTGRQRELAERNYLRKKELLNKEISSKKVFDEAKLEFDLAYKEHEKTAAMLKIFNINPIDADLAQPLIVRSPISGEVVRSDITVGQYIKSDSDPIAIVADLDRIWVIASVKEKDLGAINLKDQVEIFTESLSDMSVKGSVDYIGNIMNEQTRSVEVYIECDNPEQVLKCGMFVTVRFYHKLDNAIIIPSSSVLQDYDKCFLFVQKGPDLFVKRKVSVISIPGNRIIVHSGLEPGNIIVSEGGIYLQ